MAAPPPRTLVIDTATVACSVALLADGQPVARLYDEVGRGHAERLLPMIAELPGGGRADAVLVDCGPGSFTGVRVGLAAARALGLGWDVPVRGYSSLALVAAQAIAPRPDIQRVAAVLEGGHGEVFVRTYDRDLLPMGDMASLKPDTAIERLSDTPLAGSGVHRLLALRPDLDAADLLPDAGEAWRLPPTLASLPPRPLYGRAPDAKVKAA
ncbi:tRNA (adenosine(37)-N6)-threonylcarbamoyltransferase complex dimerization subunit type 1 TsaB [Sphingomonas lenta]|uniref:tRNA (Adenosine(37)-N6)-threonylcarbamoyltransferase complex dimerization subunit type 1 TsaB n=1 Tax=Sphingomonas lenta TaxID=1141887 RepID=A0A2A2SFK0_9SPHN|nr:tRNA (adenosine(37)-N6)-threonylcarbamoyltransferase complex dimerization subunit type 1 TsaB [Sphingomonas lenta]PAX07791.1 tRNA (adenosine(37)-N6)-threonylcarbamoyltransferase complex dimerization subunit type 1 TsaB [Sphingomonas lenta]